MNKNYFTRSKVTLKRPKTDSELFKNMSNTADSTLFQSNSPPTTPKFTIIGKILRGITGGAALALTVVCAPFISPALRNYCLPYIPATGSQVENILAALKSRKGRLLDLGSGDGRIVLEAAKNGFQAHEVELNLWLVLYSKLDAFRLGLGGQTRFFRRDLWKFPVPSYDYIISFGVDQMMSDLEKKFESECKSGSSGVACRFPLPQKVPMEIIGHGIDTVWVYNYYNR